ncbi:MAG: Rieske 2Fe-2S domain-containing protein, partial [Pseudomonadales bacterium]
MAAPAMSRPRLSKFSEEDWQVYSQFWHPVAFSSELSKHKPHGVVLLDVPLVLYRASGGVVAAQRACPHRGADLAQGWIEGDLLNCPYHGFQFNDEGNCTKLPFAGDQDVKIPKKLCLQTFKVEEKYNLIWVC